MKTRIVIMLLALVALTVPAAAQQLFDFNGYAMVPDQIGGTLTMYSVMRANVAPTEPPIPLDFDNYEFTVVITGLTLDSIGTYTDIYLGGTVSIYQDNGTAAAYDNPATFTDGTAILVGDLPEVGRSQALPSSATANGLVTWMSGSRLNDIAPEDQVDWPLLSGISFDNLEAGYDENWDGKIEPSEPIVDTKNLLWGDLKAIYE